MELDTLDLTDRQLSMAIVACIYPVILDGPGMGRTAAALARKGWGAVEPGASGDRIFRLSQAGCDAIEADQAAFKEMGSAAPVVAGAGDSPTLRLPRIAVTPCPASDDVLSHDPLTTGKGQQDHAS